MAFGDVVQSNSGTSTTATTAPTLGSATTAGNLIVLVYAADDYNGTPNTGWTQSAEMEQQTFHGGYLWWAVATASMTIPSYTIGSAVRSTWTLVEYAGPFDASPYDISEGQFQQTSSNTYTTASMTPTSGDRLMVAGLNGQSSTNDLGAWGTFTNSFTEAKASLYNGGNPRLVISQLRRIVTANGSTAYSTGGTHTVTSSLSRSALIIAFKAAAGGGGTTYNDTTAETASAAETAGGLLTTTKAVAETAAAAETAVGLLVTTKAVAEAASATETVAGLLAFTGAIAEAASAAEATDASVVPAAAIDVTIAETAVVADTVSGLEVIAGAVAEAASAADTAAGLLTFTGAVVEVANAQDTHFAIVIPAGGTLYDVAILETLAANDAVDATGGAIASEAPLGGPGPAGEGVRRRFEIFLLDDEDEDGRKRPKRRLRLKKAELEEKVADAVEHIEAGSPRPMAPQAMVAEVSTLMGLDALLEIDRRRVERTIYRYLAAMLEDEEEEGMAMMLLAA